MYSVYFSSRTYKNPGIIIQLISAWVHIYYTISLAMVWINRFLSFRRDQNQARTFFFCGNNSLSSLYVIFLRWNRFSQNDTVPFLPIAAYSTHQLSQILFSSQMMNPVTGLPRQKTADQFDQLLLNAVLRIFRCTLMILAIDSEALPLLLYTVFCRK